MYISYILIVLDYFRALTRRVAVFEWLMPLILSLAIYLTLYKHFSSFPFGTFTDKILGLEGVLVGFSITSITFLTAGSNSNIELLKKHPVDVFLGPRQFSLYDLMLTNFSFSLFTEIGIVLIAIIAPIFIKHFEPLHFVSKAQIFSIYLFFVVQNLFLNIRNMSEVYFTLVRK